MTDTTSAYRVVHIHRIVDICATISLMLFSLAIVLFGTLPVFYNEDNVAVGVDTASYIGLASFVSLSTRFFFTIKNHGLMLFAWSAPLITMVAGLWELFSFAIFRADNFTSGFGISISMFLIAGSFASGAMYAIQPAFRQNSKV